jgi:hypothetical protein
MIEPHIQPVLESFSVFSINFIQVGITTLNDHWRHAEALPTFSRSGFDYVALNASVVSRQRSGFELLPEFAFLSLRTLCYCGPAKIFCQRWKDASPQPSHTPKLTPVFSFQPNPPNYPVLNCKYKHDLCAAFGSIGLVSTGNKWLVDAVNL